MKSFRGSVGMISIEFLKMRSIRRSHTKKSHSSLFNNLRFSNNYENYNAIY